MIQKWIIKRAVQKWTMKTGSKFEPCEKVLEMPPAAETKISQATGTHGNLPTQKFSRDFKKYF